MRRILLSFAVLALLLAPHAPAQAPAGKAQVRVSFWNLEWFPGHRPEATPAEQAEHAGHVQPEVAKLAPDVLGMSEIRGWDAAALAIAKTPGLKVDVCAQFHDKDGNVALQQCAIASRLPCLGAWGEDWKPDASGFKPRRGFAFAAYQIAPGRVLLVYSVHFKSNRKPDPGEPPNENVRLEMSRQLLAHSRSMQAAYAPMGEATVVFGGDFNTSLDDPRFGREQTLHEILRAGFTWALAILGPHERISMPGHGRYPPATFDHIFFSGKNVRVASAAAGQTGKECSDHRSVSAVLEWK